MCDVKKDLEYLSKMVRQTGAVRDCFESLRNIENYIESLKCCGNCGLNDPIVNGQYEIEQGCLEDHECNTSPDIKGSDTDHWVLKMLPNLI
jgi:hypothetical protein